MAIVVVRVEGNKASFQDVPGDVALGTTFSVKHREKVEWVLQDANGDVLKDGNFKIEFRESPQADAGHGVLVNVTADKRPTRHVLHGTVEGRDHAPASYKYELVNRDTGARLICIWRGQVLPMVGGQDSGRP